ncbi:Protein of unknown function [Gryllus bimaculatus]|nr:Protein of unknown function [Gryllus bimaculatus]
MTAQEAPPPPPPRPLGGRGVRRGGFRLSAVARAQPTATATPGTTSDATSPAARGATRRDAVALPVIHHGLGENGIKENDKCLDIAWHASTGCSISTPP